MTNIQATNVPQAIRQAAMLMWWSLAIGVAATCIQIISLLSIGLPIATTVVELFGFVILGVFILQIASCKNWARWLYAALFAIGITLIVGKLIFGPSGSFAIWNWLSILITTIRFALDMGALILMFDLSANRWFASKKTTKT